MCFTDKVPINNTNVDNTITYVGKSDRWTDREIEERWPNFLYFRMLNIEHLNS